MALNFSIFLCPPEPLLQYPCVRAQKKEPKPKLLGPDILRWGGGLSCEGVGAEKFGMSLETRETKLFGGISRDFAGISQRRPKSLRKKSFLAPASCRANPVRILPLGGANFSANF